MTPTEMAALAAQLRGLADKLAEAAYSQRELSVEEIDAIRLEVSRRKGYEHTFSVDFARECIKASRKA